MFASIVSWSRNLIFNHATELEALAQVYRRVDESTHRYESGGGNFGADLNVDSVGFVTNCGFLLAELRAEMDYRATRYPACAVAPVE